MKGKAKRTPRLQSPGHGVPTADRAPSPHFGSDLHGVVVPLSKLSTPSHQPQLVRWPNTEASFVLFLPETSNPGANSSGSLGSSLTNCQTCKLHVLQGCLTLLGLVFPLIHPDGYCLCQATVLRLELWQSMMNIADYLKPQRPQRHLSFIRTRAPHWRHRRSLQPSFAVIPTSYVHSRLRYPSSFH